MTEAQQPEATDRRSVDEVASALGSDLRRGLSDAEAATRLARDGPNELDAAPPVPVVDPPAPPSTTRAALVSLAQRLMHANREHFSQATTGDTRPGRNHWVFERAGKPCRRCGTAIQTAAIGEPPRDRVSYWCPTCQPERE